MNLLVPISYFHGPPRSQLWLLDTIRKNTSLLCTLPNSPIEVRGKGVTGICPHPSGGYAVCDFNRVLHLGQTGQVLSEVRCDTYNDLHSISRMDDGFLLTNTGSDSLERLDINFALLESCSYNLLRTSDCSSDVDETCDTKIADTGQRRYSDLDDYYDAPTADVRFNQRRLRDMLHLNYAVSLPDSRIAISSYRERCFFEASQLQRISNRLSHPPHDGILYDGKLWITTINGEVLAANLATELVFESVVNLSEGAPWQGWCRGLFFSNNRMFVGITAISALNEHTRWLKVNPQITRTGVYEIDKSTMQITHFYDLSHVNGARIFSITRQSAHKLPSTSVASDYHSSF